MSCPLEIKDIGKIAYKPALVLQREIHTKVLAARNMSKSASHHLLLLEHEPPVITLSKRPAASKHLVATEKQLKSEGVEICSTDRGGDVTYHGPGQLVGYPICDLNILHLRLHSYIRFLEQCIIEVLACFDIKGERDDCATGVWVNNAKICAIGIRVSHWISMHGFALNVNPNMNHFNFIIPCGLVGRNVTSMARILGKNCPSVDEVKAITSTIFLKAIDDKSKFKPHA